MLCHESGAREVTYVTETECGETTYLVKLLNFLNLRPANEKDQGPIHPAGIPSVTLGLHNVPNKALLTQLVIRAN